MHSAYGYRAPIQVEEEYCRNHTSHENAALIKGIYTAELPIQIS